MNDQQRQQSESTGRPGSFLCSEEHVPQRARFPVIDAHNHLWANWEGVDAVVRVMDAVGVVAYCDLTANLELAWVEGGYAFEVRPFDDFLKHAVQRYPGRFYGFTMARFAHPVGKPLFTDHRRFVAECIEMLQQHVVQGARGLKLLKELGLHYVDGEGRLITADDPRLAPIWAECARMQIPVLIHQADPYGFFQPVQPENEHYSTLLKYPSWSFCDARYPSFETLQHHYRNLVRRNPDTTFLLPHMANWPEKLTYVGDWLDECPNAYCDFSARIDELGRQPYSARDFLIRYQDRIYFGTDMPASEAMYRCYFRFLETYDEDFIPPDYDGTFGRHRWRIHGLGLPDEVLRKLYHENALKLVPGLARDVGDRIKTTKQEK